MECNNRHSDEQIKRLIGKPEEFRRSSRNNPVFDEYLLYCVLPKTSEIFSIGYLLSLILHWSTREVKTVHTTWKIEMWEVKRCPKTFHHKRKPQRLKDTWDIDKRQAGAVCKDWWMDPCWCLLNCEWRWDVVVLHECPTRSPNVDKWKNLTKPGYWNTLAQFKGASPSIAQVDFCCICTDC